MRTATQQLKRPSRRSPGFRFKERTYMPGSKTTQGRPGTCTVAPVRVAFRYRNSVGTLNKCLYFRGSMAGLQAPLSTLCLAPRSALRMTRGQSDLLFLHCSGLSPSALCRFLGALLFSTCPIHLLRRSGNHRFDGKTKFLYTSQTHP